MAKKSSLRKSHDDLLKLVRRLIRRSERYYGVGNGNRTDQCQRDYNDAKRLIALAPRIKA